MGTTIAAVGVITALSSAQSFSNPQGVWITVNHQQNMYLLLISGSFFPVKITKLLTGLSYTLMSYGFFNFDKLLYISSAIDYLDFPLIDEELAYFSISSGSTFVNTFSIL